MASPSQLSQSGSLGRHEEESGQQAGPTSQDSVAVVGEETIGSVVNTPASSQGSTTALSAEQRRTRQFEASSKLAVLAGTALAFQLARPQTQTGTESDVHMMCAICGMQYDARDSVTRFNCGHHYHTVCINTWQCHRADRQREEMQRHQQQGQDPWCPICRAPLEVESVWMVDLHKDAVIFRLLEMTGRPAEADGAARFHTPSHQSQATSSALTTWETNQGKLSMIVNPGAVDDARETCVGCSRNKNL